MYKLVSTKYSAKPHTVKIVKSDYSLQIGGMQGKGLCVEVRFPHEKDAGRLFENLVYYAISKIESIKGGGSDVRDRVWHSECNYNSMVMSQIKDVVSKWNDILKTFRAEILISASGQTKCESALSSIYEKYASKL